LEFVDATLKLQGRLEDSLIYGAVVTTLDKNSFDAKSAIRETAALNLPQRNSIFQYA
jgi:hypothetical protein